MPTVFRIAFQYFLMVFAAGFALGSVRVLILVDLIGERYAELAELPVMAIFCGFAARYLVQKNRSKLTIKLATFTGLISLALLLACEFTVVLELRDLSLTEYFQSRDPVSGIGYLVGLIWYAAAPVAFLFLNHDSHKTKSVPR